MRSAEREQPKHPLEPEGRGVLVFLALPFVFLGLLFFVFAAACGDSGADRATGDRGAPSATQETSATGSSARVTPTGTPGSTPTGTPRQGSAERDAPRPEKPDTATPVAKVPVPESFEESEAAFHDGRYEEASAGFASYVERRPDNPWGHYMLGLSAWKAGDLERAEEALRETTRLDPEHTKGWINLARVLLEAERPGDARAAVTRALEHDPESGDALRVLGRAAHEEGTTEEALEAYRQAILLDPDDAWSMNNLGLLHIQRGEYAAAAEALARAVQLRGDVATFQNNLGVALERTGRFAAAAEAYRTADELSDGHRKATVSLARVQERTAPDAESDPAEMVALAEAFVRTTEDWRSARDRTAATNEEPTTEERAREESAPGSEADAPSREDDRTVDEAPREPTAEAPDTAGTAP